MKDVWYAISVGGIREFFFGNDNADDAGVQEGSVVSHQYPLRNYDSEPCVSCLSQNFFFFSFSGKG